MTEFSKVDKLLLTTRFALINTSDILSELLKINHEISNDDLNEILSNFKKSKR